MGLDPLKGTRFSNCLSGVQKKVDFLDKSCFSSLNGLYLQFGNTFMPSICPYGVNISRTVLIGLSSYVKLEVIFPAGTLCFKVESFGFARKTSDPPLLQSESEEPSV